MVDAATLYRAPTTAADAEELAGWLRERVDATVAVRDRLLAGGDEDLARAFARARVLDPTDRATGTEMLGIVRYEERALADPDRAGGVLYDGLAVQDALRERLPRDERSLDHAHVVLLDRPLATWGAGDGRWHKRVAILGQPAVLSVPGLYEAPARPESYYRQQGATAALTGDAPPREVLESAVDGEFLVADDPRTTEALKGYALAALDYLDTGDPFCPEEGCRLYDAHRQEALIAAQLEEPPFCDRHAALYDP